MIRELASGEAALALPAICELRPHITDPDELARRMRSQDGFGYRLVASFEPDEESASAVAPI